MDWFTKVFVSLKVGTDWFTGLLAPPVILNGTPPAWRGLYSERSKMHSGKGRHEVESAHKGKIIEDTWYQSLRSYLVGQSNLRESV